MKFESRYGSIYIDEKDDRFILKSEIPFYEYEKEFKDISEAFNEYKRIVCEVKKIIEKIEKKKRSYMTRNTSLYTNLKKLINQGFRRILLYGPTGTGKTYTIFQLLNELKDNGEIKNYYVFTFSSGMEDIDLLGKYVIKGNKKLEFKESNLIKALKMAKKEKIAILFDEFNRASPKALNVLIPLLDGREGKCVIDNYITSEIIEAPEENVIFLFTANFGSGYSGVFRLDDAILNRIEVSLFVDYQDEVEKEVIEELESPKREIVFELRNFLRSLYKEGVINPFSTRDLKTIVSLYKISAKEELFDSIKPVLYKLIKPDPLGYPDNSVLEDIMKFCEEIVKKY